MGSRATEGNYQDASDLNCGKWETLIRMVKDKMTVRISELSYGIMLLLSN